MATPFLDGDLLVAFSASKSVAHVRNGAVLEYIPLPGATATWIPGVNSLTYFNGEFYLGAFTSADGFNTARILRIKANSTVEQIYAAPGFSYLTSIFQISFANGIPWCGVGGDNNKSVIRFNPGATWSVAAVYTLDDGPQSSLVFGGEIRRTDGCSFIYATNLGGSEGGGSFRLWQYQTCTDLSLGQIYSSPGKSITGTRIRLNNTEILISEQGFGPTNALLIDFSGNLLHTYQLPRLHSIDWDVDDAHFWAGNSNVFAPSPNLYRAAVVAESFSSTFISNEENSFTVGINGLAVYNSNVPGPPPIQNIRDAVMRFRLTSGIRSRSFGTML